MKDCGRIDNRLNHHFVDQNGIDHQVEEVAVWPFDIEVLLDISRAVAVYGLRKLDRLFVAFALSL